MCPLVDHLESHHSWEVLNKTPLFPLLIILSSATAGVASITGLIVQTTAKFHQRTG